VSFKINVNDEERCYLLKNALALLYTPENEHFGIVPLEAQYMETPVLASNSGGPKETVVEKETGFLLSKKPEDWAEKMQILAQETKLREEMGKNGKENVLNKFSFKAFANFTDEFVKKTIGLKEKKKN
jgi:alpha-1,3/alpha-1,6-mannosyltransferase